MDFLQVIGAIDGSHLSILKPVESTSDYFNQKGFCSVIIQGVVDSLGLFIDVNIGWPGKVHDARVLVIQHFIVNTMQKRFSQIGNINHKWN